MGRLLTTTHRVTIIAAIIAAVIGSGILVVNDQYQRRAVVDYSFGGEKGYPHYELTPTIDLGTVEVPALFKNRGESDGKILLILTADEAGVLDSSGQFSSSASRVVESKADGQWRLTNFYVKPDPEALFFKLFLSGEGESTFAQAKPESPVTLAYIKSGNNYVLDLKSLT